MPRRRNKKIFPVLIIFFIISFILTYFVNKQALPLFEYYAENQGISTATAIINEAVKETLGDNSYDSENFVNYEKNESGEITAINIDTIKLNTLKASLTYDVIKSLKKIRDTPVNIPFGTLSGIGIFYGKGPDIHINLIPEGGVTSDIKTDFYSSGINQTVHRIYWEVNTDFSVVLPNKTISFSVPCRFLLSETVIVGEIPKVYFQNQGE